MDSTGLECLGFRVLGFGFWVLGLGFGVWGLGFRVLGFGFWVLGFGFWVFFFSRVVRTGAFMGLGLRGFEGFFGCWLWGSGFRV